MGLNGFIWQCETYLASKTGYRRASTSASSTSDPHFEPTPIDKRRSSCDVSSSRSLEQQQETTTKLATHHAPTVSSMDGTASIYATYVSDRTSVRAADTSIRSSGFDQFILRREELASYAVDMFQDLNVLEALGIPSLDMLAMVQATEKRYHDHPYHNFRHAFDVLQATYHLLHKTGMALTATKVELFALMATALLHDVGHPGLTNAFHDQSDTPYHLLAKTDPNRTNIKANEYYHLKVTHEVLLDAPSGLLSQAHYGDELRADVASLVETLIYATDPATQNNFFQELDARLAAEEPLNADCVNQEDKRLLLCLIMRCADIFHPCRPFVMHKKWALAIAQEFCSEGIMEMARGITPSAMKDPSTYMSSLGESTSGFIDFLVIPLFSRFVEIFPGPYSKNIIERLRATQGVWKTYDQYKKRRQIAEAP